MRNGLFIKSVKDNFISIVNCWLLVNLPVVFNLYKTNREARFDEGIKIILL